MDAVLYMILSCTIRDSSFILLSPPDSSLIPLHLASSQFRYSPSHLPPIRALRFASLPSRSHEQALTSEPVLSRTVFPRKKYGYMARTTTDAHGCTEQNSQLIDTEERGVGLGRLEETSVRQCVRSSAQACICVYDLGKMPTRPLSSPLSQSSSTAQEGTVS